MLTYNNALQIVRETALSKLLDTEKVPLAEAVGRVCAGDLTAGLDIQPFDNSAMDGFAVRLKDVAAATDSAPVRLKKAGVAGAGAVAGDNVLEDGTCWHVMTGAVLPAGTEAIIPVENAVIEGDFVSFNAKPADGQHIRYAGEDFKKGAPLMFRGERISVARIMPLAALGVAEILVFKKSKILLIPTGTEIVDDLNAPLQTGQIYNSNKFYAVAFLTACGADVTVHDTIRDDVDSFMAALRAGHEGGYDMIVSSGAVSAGSFDFVRAGLEKAGADILFHKIKLKPGKPNLLAKLPSGALYFGLPGNPVATTAGLRFFVAEALRVMQMQKPESPVYARAMNGFSKKPGLHMILKGKTEHWEDGSVTVDILDGQESFKVSPFLSMDCWVHVPEERENIKSGDVVEIYPLQV